MTHPLYILHRYHVCLSSLGHFGECTARSWTDLARACVITASQTALPIMKGLISMIALTAGPLFATAVDPVGFARVVVDTRSNTNWLAINETIFLT